MKDWSHCPSCKSLALPLKNGLLRYAHSLFCAVGRLSYDDNAPKGSRRCDKCGATVGIIDYNAQKVDISA